jgi:hypothetical protein
MFLPSGALIALCCDSLALSPPKSHRCIIVIRLIFSLRRLRISRSGNSPIIADNKGVCDRRTTGKEMVGDDGKGNITVVIHIGLPVRLFSISGPTWMISAAGLA